MQEVIAFPKDLRASHGFDNQANQLTLSPLLLDAFLRLSVSITESPDFNEQTVGIWEDFFAEPDGPASLEDEVQQRLRPFLRIACRGAVEDGTLVRYRDYAVANIRSGLSFTSSMKKPLVTSDLIERLNLLFCAVMQLYRQSMNRGRKQPQMPFKRRNWENSGMMAAGSMSQKLIVIRLARERPSPVLRSS